MRGRELRYEPALDGLRGIAVLAVLLYHGQVGWARGGFLGVDLFFVLSGYLITSLLLAEWDRTGRVDLIRFWARRARRLLPALFLVLLAVAAYSATQASPGQRRSLRLDSVSTFGYVANWRFALSDQSYFAQYDEPSPLRHMWSLGIEEQYYLAFPLILIAWLGLTYGRTRLLGIALLLGAGMSALLMNALFDPRVDPSRVYYGTDTRAQALLVGAFLGVWASDHPVRDEPSRIYLSVFGWHVPLPGWSIFGTLCLGGFAALVLLARDQSPFLYRGGLLVTAIVCAALITAATRVAPDGVFRWLLCSRPLIAVGVISYGLYLWHWPVYVFLNPDRTGLRGFTLLTLRIMVTLVVAALSYCLVERPIRERVGFRVGSSLRPAAVTALAMVTVLVAILASTATSATTPAVSGADVSPSSGATRVFLVGDSVAYGLWHDFEQRTRRDLSVQGSTQLGCGLMAVPTVVAGQVEVLGPGCASFDDRWHREVNRLRPDIAILMLGIGEQFDRQVDGRTVRFGTPAYEQFLDKALAERVAVLGSEGRPVVLMTVPCHKVPDSGTTKIPAIINDERRVDWMNSVQQRFAARHPTDVSLIDLHGFICPDGYRDELPGVRHLHTDGLHFSNPGVQAVWRWMGPQLIRLLQESGGE